MTPSINRMIALLSDRERKQVSKADVIYLEEQIINMLDFDFNFLSPLSFLERFLRLSECPKDSQLSVISLEIIKIAAADMSFLDFKPSEIAGAALVIS